MQPAPMEAPLPVSSPTQKRFANLRGVRWRIDLGILPSSSSASIEDLRRVAADSRRRYASLRRRLLADPHLPKDGSRSPDLAMDNPLSQNPDSTWGRFFRNAELEKMVDQDLWRLYPENGSYFQMPACQAMLGRILLLWCLRHPEYGYRQGMHELLAPLVYVLHVDLEHLSQVQKLYEDCFGDEFDGLSFPENDLLSSYSSNYRFEKAPNWGSISDKEKDCQGSTTKVSSLDELNPDTRDIFLLSDPYGAEGELGVILSERFMEHDAYCMFECLMNGSRGVVAMADFFSPSAVGSSTALIPIIEASSAVYHLLSIVDSSFHSHLVELGVEPQYFALRWLRVLFGREFCLDDLLVIWDELLSSPNVMCIDKNVEYNFKVFCSPRGALIAAMAVSMLLHLRSSLLATENATSCLQRLLNFPKNADLNKLISRAKSLQVIGLDSNISSPQRNSSQSKLSPVSRGSSLPSGTASPGTTLHPLPDSYWEEKWRVLHNDEAHIKGSNKGSTLTGLVKKSLSERFGLRRSESDPSHMKAGSGKKVAHSARRNLLDDLSRNISPKADNCKLETDEAPVNSNKESLFVDLNAGEQSPGQPVDQSITGRTSDCMAEEMSLGREQSPEKPNDQSIKGRTSDCMAEETCLGREQSPEKPNNQSIEGRTSDCIAEETCLSGENSSMFSTATSPHSVGNDPENFSERSSVTSNSFVADNDEERIHVEESCSQSNGTQPVQDPESTSPLVVKPGPDESLKQAAVFKERKSLSGKFQWFWKFGRVSDEGNLEKGGEESQRSPSAGNINECAGNSASDGSCKSCSVSRRIDVGDKKMMGTLKNLGQSMLENIQVIESVFQQERGQCGSTENLSNHILSAKGQVTAMAALKELRKISILLCEM